MLGVYRLEAAEVSGCVVQDNGTQATECPVRLEVV